MADVGNDRGVVVDETEGRRGLLGASDEKLDRLIAGQAAGVDRLVRIRHPQ
jgi:hypothetical protein